MLPPLPAWDEKPVVHHPVAAALTIGGAYSAFWVWAYFAWYRIPAHDFVWGGDGLFQVTEYAGGSDKLGHAWSTMALSRGGIEVLRRFGGYSTTTSALVGAGLAELLFIGVEFKDGTQYEFSFGDAGFDTLGAVMAVALTLVPRLDELFDYRVQYFPSPHYRRQFEEGNVNAAEDYTGQIYMAALHLGGIHTLRDLSPAFRFVDLAAGFGTEGYKPDEPKGTCTKDLPDGCYHREQHWYLGVSLNAQGLFDYLFEKRAPKLATFTHGFFELFNAPYGYLAKDWYRTAPPRSFTETE